MALSFSSLTSAQVSLGCFASGVQADTLGLQHEVAVLKGLSPPYRDIYMSQGACINYCKTNQYRYAITEEGTSCFCTNEMPPEKNRVEDARCDKPCTGYPLEMCGSETIHPYVGSAYANVLLVGNSLAQPSIVVPQKEAQSNPLDVPVIMSLKPEVRQDHEQDNAEEASGESDEGEEDEGDSKDGDEHDDQNSNEDEEKGIDDDGKAINGRAKGTKPPPRDIPIASTAVAIVCLLGIVSFLVYLGRKRKRERVRAAWVSSVFGTSGGSDNNDNHANSRSSYQWRHGDQDSFSHDSQSDLIDRRMSAIGHMGGREDSFSQSLRSSVLKPASVLTPMATSSPNYNQMAFHHRLQPVSPIHEHYTEFFVQDDCEDAELTYLDEYFPVSSPTSTSSLEPPMLQRPVSALLETTVPSHHHRYPAGHPFSANHQSHQLEHRQDSYASSMDPFPGHPRTCLSYKSEGDRYLHQDLHPQHPNRNLNRHSQPEFSKRQPPSSYRRPHSFTAKHDEDTRHRTHVLSESDTESLCATPDDNDATGMMQHFKKISIPYVQAIRQQQIESLSKEEESVQDPDYRFERSFPAPGPAPTERRWSRVLKSVGRELGQRCGSSEMSQGRGSEDNGRIRVGRSSHRQVHSGSLASFSGLGDPSHPRLRVTNPDGESC